LKKLVFNLSVTGIKQLSEVDLNLASIGKQMRQVKKEIDQLNNGTVEQIKSLKLNGKSVESLTTEYSQLKDEQVTLRTESRRLNTDLRQQAKDFDRIKQGIPDDSLIGLRRTYEKLRKEIDLLGKTARDSADGVDLLNKAADIKKQIDDIGESVGDFRSQVGSYSVAVQGLIGFLSSSGGGGGGLGVSSIIDPLSSILGGGLGGGANPIAIIGELTKLLGPLGTGITVVGAAAIAGGAALIDMTREYERQFDLVTSLTNVTNDELIPATATLNAITSTFGQDYNETLRAANSLSREFGITFSEGLELIRVGLSQNGEANNEYLDGLREYSVQAESAGLSAERFNQILIDQTRLGIFSDKGIDSVKEATERIGRFEKTAVTGLNRLGFDTGKIGEDLSSGFLSVQDVIGQAAGAIAELPDESVTARRAIEEIFGTQGVDSGKAFIETLKNIGKEVDNTNLKLTPYQERLNEVFEANLRLETASANVSAQFAGLGTSIDTVLPKLKAFGIEVFDGIVRGFRLTKKIAEEDGLFTALFASQDKLAEAGRKIREEDEAALSNLKQGAAEAQATLREQALAGTLSLQKLRAEQSKIKDEIDSARVSGEDYAQLQKDLVTVTNQVTKATQVLNKDIKVIADSIKKVAEEGSLESLTKKVSDLQSQISKASPNRAKNLITDLNQAELDLSEAKRELDDFTDRVKRANIDSLSIEEQVELYKEGIELRKELEIGNLEDSLQSEREKQEQIKRINLEAAIEIQEQDLRVLREGSAEYVKAANEISKSREGLEEIGINIILASVDDAIDEYVLVQERILNESIDNEEELQTRLSKIRLDREVASIEQRLGLQELSNEQRLKLERQLNQKLAEQKDIQAKVDINFDNREEGIGEEENNQLLSLIPEFNSSDIEGSLEKIKEFEKQRDVIVLEAALKRLELNKELLTQQGDSSLEVQTQIAEKELELDKIKNEKLLEQAEEAQSKREKLAEQEVQNTLKAYELIGEGIGSAFASVLDSSEDANEELAKTVLDSVQKIVNLYLAQLLAQEVATKSFAGIATAAALGALVNGALAVARNAIGEDGLILERGGQLRDLRRGAIFKGNRHAQGGREFNFSTTSGNIRRAEAEEGEAIIKRTSTKKWGGLISAINEDTGGARLSSDSDRWKAILSQYDKFEDGGVTGVGVAGLSRIPTVINPSGISTTTRLSPEDINLLADTISSRQAAAVKAEVKNIGNQVADGLDKIDRLNERKALAEQNAEL